MSVQRVIIEKPEDKWRFRCPAGHTSWSTTNNHFWCPECARQHDGKPEHFELLDRKTMRKLSRDEVELRL